MADEITDEFKKANKDLIERVGGRHVRLGAFTPINMLPKTDAAPAQETSPRKPGDKGPGL